METLYTLMPLISTIAYLSGDDGWIKWIPLALSAAVPICGLFYKIYQSVSCCSFSRFFTLRRHLEFQARLRLSSWLLEPDAIVRQFGHVLWEWNRANETVNCKRVMEEAGTNRYYDDYERSGHAVPLFVDDPNQPFWNVHRPDVQYTMWVERMTDKEGHTHGEIFLRITFLNKSATPKTVIDHMAYLKNLSKEIKERKDKKPIVLVSCEKTASDDENKKGLPFMKYDFATTSTFENFFCEEARLVEEDLRHFTENKASYDRTGRPWNYTLLNEGPPGTGKTKLVKAIAAATGRTLIILNLHHIPTVQMLYDAFHNSVLAGDHVPHDQRLYYIPEVDTQNMEQLKDRNCSLKAEPKKDTKKDSKKDSKKEDSKKEDSNPAEPNWVKLMAGMAAGPAAAEQKKPTLGEILNVMDGVPERHGHILIMDTNQLDKLDPAFVRPGRVDRILSWKPMSSESIRLFLENYYETEIPESVKLPDRQITAAELQGMIASAESWEEALESLLKSDKCASRECASDEKLMAPAHQTIQTIPHNEVQTLRLRSHRLKK